MSAIDDLNGGVESSEGMVKECERIYTNSFSFYKPRY